MLYHGEHTILKALTATAIVVLMAVSAQAETYGVLFKMLLNPVWGEGTGCVRRCKGRRRRLLPAGG